MGSKGQQWAAWAKKMVSVASIRSMMKGFPAKLSSFGGTLIKVIVIGHCTLEYIGDFVICHGPSMEPNIKSDDILLTEHITPRTGHLNRGDIVIARSPSNPSSFICKRVIATEGDNLLHGDGRMVYVPRGHIWVEGDNTSNSTDSRSYGPIPVGLVRGRALARIWPLSDMTVLVPRKPAIAQS